MTESDINVTCERTCWTSKNYHAKTQRREGEKIRKALLLCVFAALRDKNIEWSAVAKGARGMRCVVLRLPKQIDNSLK
jgi:hypothetical protein